MASNVVVSLNTKASKAAFDAAKRQILAALAEATAAGAVAGSPHVSDFLESTVVAIPPGGAGVAARDEMVGGEHKQAVAVDAAGADEAIVAVAAVYALYVELRHPFLLEAAIRASAQLDAYVRKVAL
ncbi:MAG: hypothetical protein WCI67_06205 [Chloroflexales bacterium]